jgi:hypothetical protein
LDDKQIAGVLERGLTVDPAIIFTELEQPNLALWQAVVYRYFVPVSQFM